MGPSEIRSSGVIWKTPAAEESSMAVRSARFRRNGMIGLELCTDERRGRPLTLPILDTGKQKMKERKPLAPAMTGQKQSTMDATENDGVVRGVEQDPSRSFPSRPPAPNAAPTMS